MLNKICYLLGIPLVWFTVALLVPEYYADRIYLLAVAPAVWILLFVDALKMTMPQFLFGGLAGISLVGPVLLLFKIKLRTSIMISFLTTVSLWLFFVIVFGHAANNIVREHTVNEMHRGITAGKVMLAWLPCCFNFSLCFIPIIAVPAKGFMLLKNRFSKPVINLY